MSSCQDCTKYICLDIQKKMNVLEKLHLLVITLNMNDDDNRAKICGISNRLIKKLTYLLFIMIGEKASTNIPLNKTYYLRKMAKLTCLYVLVYLPLDDYPPYSDEQSDIFEAKINKSSRFIHGNTYHNENNVLITWVSIKSWKMFPSEFPQALDINPCPRTIVCNTCEMIHMSDDILNADENVEDEYEYGFTGSFFKKVPIIIDENPKM